MENKMKRIPIKTAREIAKSQKFNQILIFGWDREGNITSVATYGKTVEDCDQIAQAGNWFKKKALHWPENECCAEPSRVKKLKEKIKNLQDYITLSNEIVKPLIPLCPAKARSLLDKATERVKDMKGELQEKNEHLQEENRELNRMIEVANTTYKLTVKDINLGEHIIKLQTALDEIEKISNEECEKGDPYTALTRIDSVIESVKENKTCQEN